MAYYWITEAQKYIHRLGFGEHLRPIDNRPQAVRINQWARTLWPETGRVNAAKSPGLETNPHGIGIAIAPQILYPAVLASAR